MNKPKISIITPSFNQGQFLEETICSVLNQEYDNLEYIIIDGGSTDNSVDIIKKYDSQISYWVSEPDNGQTDAINKGFKKASGDLIAWMNSDDIYLKSSFQNLVNTYNQYPDYNVYYADKIHIDETGESVRVQRYFPYYLHSFANDKMNFCNQAAFWKRSVFNEIGYLDESIQFAMDYEFFIRMGRNGNLRFKHTPQLWGAQRYYDGTKTSDKVWLKVLSENHISINEKYKLPQSKLLKITSLVRRSLYHIFNGHISYLLGK